MTSEDYLNKKTLLKVQDEDIKMIKKPGEVCLPISITCIAIRRLLPTQRGETSPKLHHCQDSRPLLPDLLGGAFSILLSKELGHN